MKPRHLPFPFRSRLLNPAAMVGAGLLGISANSQAATDLWTGAVNANWNTTDANWNNGGTNLYTSGDVVQFGDTGGANLTINVAAAVTPASVSFTDTGAGTNAYIFNGSTINGTGTTVSLNSGFGGSVRFNVANVYTGGTTITSGTLSVGITGALGTGAITLAGGSLQSAGSGLKTLANTSIVASASTTTNLAAAGGDITLSGALTGSGTISVNNTTGASAWLSGNLSGFTGTLSHTNVNNGNNFFISGGADLSGAKVVLSGATTSNRRMGTNSAGNVSIGELSGTGGILGAGNNAATTYTIGALNTSSTYNGTFVNVGSGVASITKTGSGTLALGGANTNTGAYTINAGTLQFAKTASLYNSATGSWTAANIRSASGATVAFNVGGAGEFTTGNVTTLLGNLAASTSATNGMNAGSSLGFDTTNAGGSFTIADVIADTTGASGGSRGLVKLGTGTLNLTNTNTYTGTTTISSGKLALTGSGSISNSAFIDVRSGAELDVSALTGSNLAVGAVTTQTLGGAGTITGNAIISSGSTLAAGNGPGTLTVNGATTFNNGSIFSWDISSDGASYDKLDTTSLVDGGAVGGSIFQIVLADTSFTDNFWDNTQTWTNIFSTDGTTLNAIADWADIFSTVTVVNSAFGPATPVGGSFSVSGNTLTWSAVPEPTSALAGLLLGAGLLRRHRKI